jgi:hypothetical protein
MQQFELLRRQFHRHSGHAREVASWPIEAAYKSKLDWVAPYSENDRDIRGHGFSSVRVLPGRAITLTFRLTRSATNACNRSFLSSAQRNSIATFWPST